MGSRLLLHHVCSCEFRRNFLFKETFKWNCSFKHRVHLSRFCATYCFVWNSHHLQQKPPILSRAKRMLIFYIFPVLFWVPAASLSSRNQVQHVLIRPLQGDTGSNIHPYCEAETGEAQVCVCESWPALPTSSDWHFRAAPSQLSVSEQQRRGKDRHVYHLSVKSNPRCSLGPCESNRRRIQQLPS